MGEIKQKDFARTMLRIDPLLGKVHAFIPTTMDPKKAQVEKNVTNNFIVMMISYLLIGSRNFVKPVILTDHEGKPEYEITIKKL